MLSLVTNSNVLCNISASFLLKNDRKMWMASYWQAFDEQGGVWELSGLSFWLRLLFHLSSRNMKFDLGCRWIVLFYHYTIILSTQIIYSMDEEKKTVYACSQMHAKLSSWFGRLVIYGPFCLRWWSSWQRCIIYPCRQ